jgi:hypothetical protein
MGEPPRPDIEALAAAAVGGGLGRVSGGIEAARRKRRKGVIAPKVERLKNG